MKNQNALKESKVLVISFGDDVSGIILAGLACQGVRRINNRSIKPIFNFLFPRHADLLNGFEKALTMLRQETFSQLVVCGIPATDEFFNSETSLLTEIFTVPTLWFDHHEVTKRNLGIIKDLDILRHVEIVYSANPQICTANLLFDYFKLGGYCANHLLNFAIDNDCPGANVDKKTLKIISSIQQAIDYLNLEEANPLSEDLLISGVNHLANSSLIEFFAWTSELAERYEALRKAS